MKITKRQLKRIIKEELKVVKRKSNKLNEGLQVMSDGEPYGAEFLLSDPNNFDAQLIGGESAVRDLIAKLQKALGDGIESLPVFEG